MPTMKGGDILGHEFMGEVVETGSAHTKVRKDDRIVVPFNINCGECRQCKLGNYSICQRSNRNAAMAAAQLRGIASIMKELPNEITWPVGLTHDRI